MIFCLIGKSASGKDSIYKKLLNTFTNLYAITIYTTRPRRDTEIDGREYFFVDEAYLKKIEKQIIEKRIYNTFYGPWIYATVDDGQIEANKNYLIIATLESYSKIKKRYGEKNVYPLYIDVPYDIRYERAKLREKNSAFPHYEEMNRRFMADEIDFSKENLQKENINKTFVNVDFDECLLEIINEIKPFLTET